MYIRCCFSGVCCYWLGKVAQCCQERGAFEALKAVQVEMIARGFKTLLYRRLNKKNIVTKEEQEEEPDDDGPDAEEVRQGGRGRLAVRLGNNLIH